MLSYKTRAGLSRIGIILSNMSITLVIGGIVCAIASLVTLVIPIAGLALWLMLAMVTIFILLANDTFRSIPGKLVAMLSATSEFTFTLIAASPYVLLGGMVLGIVSAVFLFFEPSTNKHRGRIAVTCVFIAVAIAFIIIALAK